MKKIILPIIILIITASCSQKEETKLLPYYDDAFFTPKWYTKAEEVPSNFHKIPSFGLLNQSGETVTEKSFENKIYVADFFFASCPGICPKMTANMTIIQEEFKTDDEVLLLSHSVTPAYDSVSVLNRYGSRNGVIPGKWHLVTGDREEIYNLGRNYYFAEEDLGLQKSTDDFLHTENFLLIDQNRHIRGIYNGLNKTAINQLIEDIKTLKKAG
ncbi:MAG: SCO family protein [bacterium]|nr:SCO family protein [bacterium]